MKKNISKSREQELANVINQMDSWIQDKTRLIFSINTPLFNLFLRGRVVTHQERLFLLTPPMVAPAESLSFQSAMTR